MINLYKINQADKWDNIVKSFAKYDVYYLSGYVKAFQIHGDGEPKLLYYQTDNLKAMYVYMKRKTDIVGYFDSVTPYGYGGVLFEGNTSNEQLCSFWAEYKEKMLEDGIVDNFVRYHPILGNCIPMKKISTVIDLGKTIAMDLSSKEVIWENITSKNRNMIRKAEKNGIKIFHGKDMSLFSEFKNIYNATMDKDNADAYYYFNDAFYESINRDLHNNYELFYAIMDEKIIAMSIIIFANKQMHYHLSGSIHKYRNLAPSNLLLYQAALWGCNNGFKTFHLGGGVGSGEDNLYKFKAAFNRNSNHFFSIGKELFNQKKYEELIEIRLSKNKNFDKNSSYFPVYRSS